jgi:hypothetical protein
MWSGAGAILYDPDNKDVYVTGYASQEGSNQNNAFLFAISSSTNKIVANASISDYFPTIQFLAYSPANKDMYFCETDGNGVGYLASLVHQTKSLLS